MRALLLFPLLLALPAHAAPPVADGLLLHLDAAAQPTLRQAAAMPPVSRGQPVDVMLDSSPAQRRFTQPLANPRPLWQTDGQGAAYLIFDGNDDFLTSSAKAPLPAAVTVFIVARVERNPGDFRCLFASAATGQNDYTSGMNIDFGKTGTQSMSFVNIESAGADREQDMLRPGKGTLAADLPFGGFHLFTMRSRIATNGCELRIDRVPSGSRDRLESHIALDEMVLGSRLYSHDPAQPPHAQNHLPGQIAQVLVYGRDLPDKERDAVESWLMDTLPGLNALASGASGHSLQVLPDAPPLQMLVPGFSVSELPVKLTNRNNLRYRHDGKLVALGYDGTIHLLTDTDGDGLEDHAEVFWEKETMRGPLGIALLPKDDPRGDGVFVASKGKVSLILDKDRDGKADEEIIAATGWQEIPQNVDAVGMAVDPKDGSLYFCLGTANYANAYLIDPATGKAGYDLKSDRGTIQKVSADFKKRETVCTGVRFACALAFNEHGDLFATEQEGATWLPNGNALDELLHIQPGKHYGFPPRHPKHLPDVLDWPAVMEYGPQHQSTVGMVFNTGVNGGPHFGPDFWKGDALVCGEARGKIWRTKLVKTSHGYVGQNHLIACLGLLTVDACVSPQGDMLVACHSGPPDWGTGPKGEGRIFKVKYTGKEVPQPVWAWASAPDEFTIAFDKELKPEEWANRVAHYPVLEASSAVSDHLQPSKSVAFIPLESTVRIEAGQHVSAGDRFETIRPGYQVVRDQMAAPRRDVKVLGLSLSADRRNILLKVPRQTEPVGYAVTLPLPESWLQQSAVPQKPELDVLVTLNGVEVIVANTVTNLQRGALRAKEILPVADPLAGLLLMDGSMRHETFGKLFDPKEAAALDSFYVTGILTDSNPFVPRVQAGSALDWTPPHFTDKTVVEFFAPWTDPAKVQPAKFRRFDVRPGLATGIHAGHTIFKSGEAAVPLPAANVLLPWAEEKSGDMAARKPDAPHGNWLEGRQLYFGEAACFTCHQIRGEGIAVGPDLTNLVSRDPDSVLADILKPSATINPDHPASAVELKNGTVVTGIVRQADDAKVSVTLPGGAVQEFPRADVSQMKQLRVSLMPEGYGERLTKAQQDDLLAFLLTSPLEPAKIERDGAPPPRKWSEIPEPLRAVMQPAAAPAAKSAKAPAPLRILLCAGPKDHGPGEHDYPLWQERWSKLLPLAPGVSVARTMTFPTREELGAADVAVFFSKNPGWNPAAAARLDEFTQRGGGLVYLHWAVEGGADVMALADRIGLATQGSVSTKYRHGPVQLDFINLEHPVTRGFPAALDVIDETYWNLQGDPGRVRVLANGVEESAPRPQIWVREQHAGRVFAGIPGHYNWTFDDPLYRLLVLRGICWTGKQENTDRLSALSTVGARVQW